MDCKRKSKNLHLVSKSKIDNMSKSVSKQVSKTSESKIDNIPLDGENHF